MRAAIDIGSNSIRLACSDGTRRSDITKLADGIEKTGALSANGVAATIAVLGEYAALCGGCDTVAFATEAVRRASDGKKFIERVKRETGIAVTVLSPQKEAELALMGAKKPDGPVTVCDLGGGSLEVISSDDGKTVRYVKSLPLGVVVLKNKFNGDYRAAIDSAPSLVEEYGAVPRYPVVMIGGSACTIAAGFMSLPYYDAKKVNGARLTAKELDGFLPVLMSDKLPILRPVCAKRADTVAYGGIIIQALINHLGAAEFTVSDSSNLEAVLAGAQV